VTTPETPQSVGDRAQDTINKAKETVQQVGSQLGNEAQRVAGNVQHTVKGAEDKVQQTVANAAEARRAMRETAYTVKETASDSLLTAAENIRREALKSGSDDVVRQAHQLARSMEKAALYLDSHTFEQISTDATEVVKANPWESLGVVFILGLVLGMLFGGNRD
jgi:ElaB/YqjD/DUF883 family membrane-anchored ribosome-binding protein